MDWLVSLLPEGIHEKFLKSYWDFPPIPINPHLSHRQVCPLSQPRSQSSISIQLFSLTQHPELIFCHDFLPSSLPGSPSPVTAAFKDAVKARQNHGLRPPPAKGTGEADLFQREPHPSPFCWGRMPRCAHPPRHPPPGTGLKLPAGLISSVTLWPYILLIDGLNRGGHGFLIAV